MSTAQFLIERIKASGGFTSVIQKSTGWLLIARFEGDRFDSYINVMHDGTFIIMLPIGNKLSSSFFPAEEQHILMTYFRHWIDNAV